MEERNYFIFEEQMSQEQAFEQFKNELANDSRFESSFDEKLLTIEEKYIAYYFFQCNLLNHAYFFKNKQTGESFDGKMDVSYSSSDPEFVLNELVKTQAVSYDTPKEFVLDNNKYEIRFKEVIEKIKEKFLINICSKHNIKPSKAIHIDISPLEGFHDFICDTYYEKVFVFRYRNEQRKKDFVSVLSAYKKEFYQFDFVKSESFLQFLTKYKRPLEYIPSFYYDWYYKDSFMVYNQVNKRLEFDTYKGILKKIKDNIQYDSYSSYEDYLKSGIYYYRIRKYLKKLPVVDKPLKYHIYLAFLTLKYQMNSGYFLYECACLNLIEKNSINDKVRFLEYSYHLGSLEAKRALYEHYSLPLYFDANMIKKYS